MKEKSRLIKTYISEANQNRISETLSVEGEDIASVLTEKDTTSSDEESRIQIPQAEEESDEPEALSAPLILPPTTAAYDAEAVAGFTIGETYGDQGDYIEGNSNTAK
jgi:hypothetical protein